AGKQAGPPEAGDDPGPAVKGTEVEERAEKMEIVDDPLQRFAAQPAGPQPARERSRPGPGDPARADPRGVHRGEHPEVRVVAEERRGQADRQSRIVLRSRWIAAHASEWVISSIFFIDARSEGRRKSKPPAIAHTRLHANPI